MISCTSADLGLQDTPLQWRGQVSVYFFVDEVLMGSLDADGGPLRERQRANQYGTERYQYTLALIADFSIGRRETDAQGAKGGTRG